MILAALVLAGGLSICGVDGCVDLNLTPSATEYLRNAADGFDPERSLRIQAALLREDLIWQSRGFSKRQIDMMVFVTVALSLENVDEALKEARKDPKGKSRVGKIELYQTQAEDLVESLFDKVKDIPENELRFYF